MFPIREARRLSMEHGTANPAEIAEKMGIEILTLPLRNIPGLCATFGHRKFIGVSADLRGMQRRLVIAHELGHLVLHPKGSFAFIIENTQFYGRFEYQANLFAIALCLGSEVALSQWAKEAAARGMDFKSLGLVGFLQAQ